MHIVESIAELRQIRKSYASSVGLVTTMGYLHDGHLSLVNYSRDENDTVIATIFVNPTQFGEGEDFDSYPRDSERDLALLRDAGVDCVFMPSPKIMYPPNFQTKVTIKQVTQGREGGQREGHFVGVATVVAKLFNITQPTIAYFGQKDAQQAVVIRQLIRDLNFPLKMAVCPTQREADGLAMSSRNVYLSAEERQSATVLYRALQATGQAYDSGERNPNTLRAIAQQTVHREPLAYLDYVSLADTESFQEVKSTIENPVLLSLAAKVGKPRLLDNCLLPLSLNNRQDLSRLLGVD